MRAVEGMHQTFPRADRLRIQSADGDKAQSTEARYSAREQDSARDLGDRGAATAHSDHDGQLIR